MGFLCSKYGSPKGFSILPDNQLVMKQPFIEKGRKH
jgi:hypothetical protein